MLTLSAANNCQHLHAIVHPGSTVIQPRSICFAYGLHTVAPPTRRPDPYTSCPVSQQLRHGATPPQRPPRARIRVRYRPPRPNAKGPPWGTYARHGPLGPATAVRTLLYSSTDTSTVLHWIDPRIPLGISPESAEWIFQAAQWIRGRFPDCSMLFQGSVSHDPAIQGRPCGE